MDDFSNVKNRETFYDANDSSINIRILWLSRDFYQCMSKFEGRDRGSFCCPGVEVIVQKKVKNRIMTYPAEMIAISLNRIDNDRPLKPLTCSDSSSSPHSINVPL